MITKAQIEKIVKRINGLDESSKRVVLKTLGSIDVSDRERLLKILNEVIKPLAKASFMLSAQIGAAAYTEMRVSDLGEAIPVEAVSSFDEGKFAAMCNTAVSKRSTEELVNVVNGYFGYNNRASYSNTMFNARTRDPVKPRYARVPQGSENCQFCMMLASRGFTYMKGKDGVKVHNHANCDCVYVASWSNSPKAEGYDPSEWEEKWNEAVYKDAKAASERNGTTVEEEHDRIMSYYRNSAKHSKAGKSNSVWKSDRFENFNAVKQYVHDAGSQEELEHRYSELLGLYGPDKMRKQSMKDAVRHTEKRL